MSAPRAPFYVPRPADETFWLNTSKSSPAIPLLTMQKLFGKGGQVNTKAWRDDYNIAESFWDSANSKSSPVIPALTAQKLFGKGGQVNTKALRADYNVAESFWSAAVIDSIPLPLFNLSPQTIKIKGGLWGYNYDDAPSWNGAAINSNTLPLSNLSPQSINIIDRLRGYNYDDAGWSNNSIAFPLSHILLPGGGGGFGTNMPRAPLFVPRPADETYWSGTPIEAPLAALTFELYQTGNQYFAYTDDPAIWYCTSTNPTALSILVNPFGINVPRAPLFVPRPADETYWSGSPLPALEYQVGSFTISYVDNYFFSYTDDAPVWYRNSPVRPIAISVTPSNFGTNLSRAPFFVPKPVPEAYWISFHANSQLLPLTVYKFESRYFSYTDDHAGWIGSSIDSAPIQILSSRKLFAAGGQSLTKQWHYDFDDQQSILTNKNSNVLSTLTSYLPAVNSRRFDIDDGGIWQSQGEQRNPALSSISATINHWHLDAVDDQLWTITVRPAFVIDHAEPFIGQFSPSYDDHAIWQGSAIASKVLAPLLTSGGQIQSHQWLFGYDDPAYWVNSPAASEIIPTLTVGGLIKANQSRYDYDDAPAWFTRPSNPNAVALTVQPNPVFTRQFFVDETYWSGFPANSQLLSLTPYKFQNRFFNSNDDAFVWSGNPISSDPIRILSSRKLFASGGQGLTKPWRYDFDDQAASWQHPVQMDMELAAGLLNLYLPFIHSSNLSWNFASDDSSTWQWKPRNNRFLPYYFDPERVAFTIIEARTATTTVEKRISVTTLENRTQVAPAEDENDGDSLGPDSSN